MPPAQPAAATAASVPPVASVPPATRVYLGSDGVKVPLITDAEQQARRHQVKHKRRRGGRKRRSR